MCINAQAEYENHVHLLTLCSQFYTDKYTQSLESMMVEAYIWQILSGHQIDHMWFPCKIPPSDQ